jgi:multidrug efflux pump subunit AcrA (membrane-fusion protein)
MKCKFMLLAGAMLSLTAVAAQPRQPSQATILVPRCRISLIDDVYVPAEEAGRLLSIEVRDGQYVEAGDVLAQIDDRQPQHIRAIADLQQRAAGEEADSDVRVRHAHAAAEVAQAEHDQASEANRRHRDTVPKSEIRRKRLAWDTARLQAEQAALDQRLAGWERDTKAAEVAAADTAIDRRTVRAPLSGLIVGLERRRGEWVQPGETILRLVRIDRVWVEGYLAADEFLPEEVEQQSATVRVRLPTGSVELPGQIVFASPIVEAGEFLVRAEVENRGQAGRWLLRPGLAAELTIDRAVVPDLAATDQDQAIVPAAAGQ